MSIYRCNLWEREQKTQSIIGSYFMPTIHPATPPPAYRSTEGIFSPPQEPVSSSLLYEGEPPPPYEIRLPAYVYYSDRSPPPPYSPVASEDITLTIPDPDPDPDPSSTQAPGNRQFCSTLRSFLSINTEDSLTAKICKAAMWTTISCVGCGILAGTAALGSSVAFGSNVVTTQLNVAAITGGGGLIGLLAGTLCSATAVCDRERQRENLHTPNAGPQGPNYFDTSYREHDEHIAMMVAGAIPV